MSLTETHKVQIYEFRAMLERLIEKAESISDAHDDEVASIVAGTLIALKMAMERPTADRPKRLAAIRDAVRVEVERWLEADLGTQGKRH